MRLVISIDVDVRRKLLGLINIMTDTFSALFFFLTTSIFNNSDKSAKYLSLKRCLMILTYNNNIDYRRNQKCNKIIFKLCKIALACFLFKMLEQ